MEEKENIEGALLEHGYRCFEVFLFQGSRVFPLVAIYYDIVCFFKRQIMCYEDTEEAFGALKLQERKGEILFQNSMEKCTIHLTEGYV